MLRLWSDMFLDLIDLCLPPHVFTILAFAHTEDLTSVGYTSKSSCRVRFPFCQGMFLLCAWGRAETTYGMKLPSLKGCEVDSKMPEGDVQMGGMPASICSRGEAEKQRERQQGRRKERGEKELQ